MKCKHDYYNPILNNEIYYLLTIFIIIFVIKSLLSLSFTPFIWADEYIYSHVANNLFESNYGDLFKPYHLHPIGYPLFLSIAHLFSENKAIIYHVMLLINSLLTSSIFFPSYFLLKKYIPFIQALLGSILISVLPAVTVYNFSLFTENLFIPLTIFSVWFLHESFEKNKIWWDLLAGISVFYLYFTRDSTGAAFIIAYIVAQAFYFLNTRPEKRFSILKNKVFLICAVIIPLTLWMIYKTFLAPQKSYFNPDLYLSNISTIFLDITSLKSFLNLLLYHIEYLAISSYVIVFLVSLALIHGSLTKSSYFGFNTSLQRFFSDKTSALRSIIVYCLVFSAGLLVINVLFLLSVPDFISIHGPIQGRYIYPIIPVIFLFGIIGSGFIFHKNNNMKSLPEVLAVLGIPLVYISMYIMPLKISHVINNYGIVYFNILLGNMDHLLIFVLFTTVFLIIPYYFFKNRDNKYCSSIFLIFLIILSILVTIPTYDMQRQFVETEYNLNQIGRYLEKSSSPETIILMDAEDSTQLGGGFSVFYGTKFWASGKVDVADINEGSYQDYRYADYIISKKWLPYSCVSASYMINTYKLYDVHGVMEPYTWGREITFGKDGNAKQYEVDGWSTEKEHSWALGNESSLKLILDTIPEHVFFTLHGTPFTGPNLSTQRAIFSINHIEIAKPIIMDNTFENVTIPVPPGYLKRGENVITFSLPDAISPKELGISEDMRILGIAIRSIRLSTNGQNI
jgi:hypothetical protein